MEQIEEATVEDIPQLADLLGMLFSQEADFSPDLEKQVRGLRLIVDAPERGRIFVARSDGQIVGTVCLLFTVSTAEGAADCWLEDMVVRPDCRAAGLGSRLLDHAIAFAKDHGFVRITLLTDRANAGAIQFYRRRGFQPSSMTPLRLHL